tara:strand:- start:1695 stop:2111 length:417 start_codon:yes stop_codon:yes gene_type:complete
MSETNEDIFYIPKEETEAKEKRSNQMIARKERNQLLRKRIAQEKAIKKKNAEKTLKKNTEDLEDLKVKFQKLSTSKRQTYSSSSEEEVYRKSSPIPSPRSPIPSPRSPSPIQRRTPTPIPKTRTTSDILKRYKRKNRF